MLAIGALPRELVSEHQHLVQLRTPLIPMHGPPQTLYTLMHLARVPHNPPACQIQCGHYVMEITVPGANGNVQFTSTGPRGSEASAVPWGYDAIISNHVATH
jgi:hypothetical protein